MHTFLETYYQQRWDILIVYFILGFFALSRRNKHWGLAWIIGMIVIMILGFVSINCHFGDVENQIMKSYYH